ncbi:MULTISPECIES: hypothetical protein [Oleiagrimonas]|uniref:Lipoprotein n=1 Tax=Oleiagrimonas citrea TaxID=1665687 RepID=A0A846ZMM5_9GAMM|nr:MULTISPECIES: hypothetical protein [Oleiagrimonas]NKZ38703.1 hypothetical protein [Oleiagrimonas citrea]RAP56218.1 hypothetical protein BTJ49_14270 [Oleiagrimonas sp. MCCC 1A03011]
MKRILLLAASVLALAALGGCVTPAYRYSGGNGGYYYGQAPTRSQTVIYGGSSAYYGDPWYTPYAWGPGVHTQIYYYGDGHRRYRHDDRDRRYRDRDDRRHRDSDYRRDHDRYRSRSDSDRRQHAQRRTYPTRSRNEHHSNRLGAAGQRLLQRQQSQQRQPAHRSNPKLLRRSVDDRRRRERE